MRASAEDFFDLLICPICGSSLDVRQPDRLRCSGAGCDAHGMPFMTADRRPVLIDFEKSLFDRNQLAASEGTSPVSRSNSKVMVGLARMLRGRNNAAIRNARTLLAHLRENESYPKVLVIGGGTVGEGADALLADSEVRVITFDIYASPPVDFLADAHGIPLRSASIDAVWVQAVLEHVLDPAEVVAEIRRVLKPAGWVYAETPFMQQVHEGAYDFTRFTHSGHRWLFRDFEETASGFTAGIGTALIWSLRHFFAGVSRSRRIGNLAALVFFWLRFFDRLVPESQNLDGASGVFFLGRKPESETQPLDIVGYYQRGTGSGQ